MKWIMAILCFFMSFNNCYALSNSSYILINQTNGEVIEGNNIHYSQSVASISKIMTAIIIIENCDITNEIIVPNEVLKAYGSAVYIQPNTRITILDLLYGTLTRSGNDSSLVLSLQLDNFVEKMNEKAKQLNMTNTIFRNPTGLDEEDGGNISSAYDMAILMRYCMNNPIFREIVSTKKYKRMDGLGYWTNKNKLLFEYEYCNGGKTGYTKKAGRTLVTSAYKDNMEFICVTIRQSDDFNFHQELYEYYFKKYPLLFDLNQF